MVIYHHCDNSGIRCGGIDVSCTICRCVATILHIALRLPCNGKLLTDSYCSFVRRYGTNASP
jgi:hypothetical protein